MVDLFKLMTQPQFVLPNFLKTSHFFSALSAVGSISDEQLLTLKVSYFEIILDLHMNNKTERSFDKIKRQVDELKYVDLI